MIGDMPKNPTLGDILLYQCTREEIGKFAYCLPELLKFPDEFTAELEKTFNTLTEESKKKIFYEHVQIILEELYKNKCITKAQLTSTYNQYTGIIPGGKNDSIKLILNSSDQIKPKKSDNLDLSEDINQDAKKIADSMRAHGAFLLSQVSPMDFYGCKWKKQKGTPLNEITDFFNSASGYIVNDIMSQDNMSKIQERAIFWNKVFDKALDNKDYNTCEIIKCALGNSQFVPLDIKKPEETPEYKKAIKGVPKESGVHILHIAPVQGLYFLTESESAHTYDKKGSIISELLSSVEKSRHLASSNATEYAYHGNIIELMKKSPTADEQIKKTTEQRKKIKFSKVERDYGESKDFLNTFYTRHFIQNEPMPQILTIRCKQEFDLKNETEAHKFILGEIQSQLHHGKEKQENIARDKLFNLTSALKENAKNQNLDKSIINKYDKILNKAFTPKKSPSNNPFTYLAKKITDPNAKAVRELEKEYQKIIDKTKDAAKEIRGEIKKDNVETMKLLIAYRDTNMGKQKLSKVNFIVSQDDVNSIIALRETALALNAKNKSPAVSNFIKRINQDIKNLENSHPTVKGYVEKANNEVTTKKQPPSI